MLNYFFHTNANVFIVEDIWKFLTQLVVNAGIR